MTAGPLRADENRKVWQILLHVSAVIALELPWLFRFPAASTINEQIARHIVNGLGDTHTIAEWNQTHPITWIEQSSESLELLAEALALPCMVTAVLLEVVAWRLRRATPSAPLQQPRLG